MAKIFLQDARVSLVTCSFSDAPESRRPAVVVHADLSAIQYERLENSEESLTIMRFSLTHIEPVSEDVSNPLVKAYFNTPSGEVSFKIPLQYFSVSMKLSRFNGGLGVVPVFVLDSSIHPSVNPAEVIPVEDMAFLLCMPDAQSEAGENISEMLSAIYHHSVVDPAAALDWDEVENDDSEEIDPSVEFALSRLLNGSLSLSRGDTAPIFDVPDMFSQEWEGPIVPLGLHLSAIHQIANLVHSAAPHQRSAYNTDSEGSVIPSRATNEEFLRLLQEAGLESSFRRIAAASDGTELEDDEQYSTWKKDLEIWDAPACEAWPEAMEPVRSYLEGADLLEDVEDLIDWGFDEEGAYSEKIEAYGVETLMLGAYAFFAQYAHKYHQIIDSNQPLFTPQSVVISWIGQRPQGRWWELESVADELASYNTANAADIAIYGSIHYEDRIILPYLAPIIVEIGAFLLEDDSFAALSPEDLVEELSKLSFRGQEYSDFESFLLRYFRKIHEVLDDEDFDDEDASAQAIAAYALQFLVDPSIDFHKLAKVILLAFPVLSELKANAEMEPFTEEWEDFRYANLRSMVSEISSNIPRRVYVQT